MPRASRQLSVPLPDNLTTWRATARGVTYDTAAGATTAELLVTKPLLVRLIAPRFWTQDDRVRVQVIVQNNTAVKQDLRVSLRGEDAAIGAVGAEAKGAQSGTVPANSSASFYWDVEAPIVPAPGRMSLTSTAAAKAPASVRRFDRCHEAGFSRQSAWRARAENRRRAF